MTTSHPIIAPGGIKTRREIAALEKMGMHAAIGMALYKNYFAYSFGLTRIE